MAEFNSDPSEFRRRTIRRMLVEFLVLGLAVAMASFNFVPVVPTWIQWGVVVSVGVYILASLVLYPRAKAIAESFRLRLDDEGLTFSHAHGGGRVRYADLKITEVKRHRNEPVEIVVVSEDGQVIRLSGLVHMRRLHELLSVRIKS